MEKHSDNQITLREMVVSDADDFFRWYSDEKVSQFCSWEAFTSKEDAIKFALDTIILHPWQRAICLSDRVVGSITVHELEKCRAELGYVVASEYWGKGIATRAVKMAAKQVFEEWGHLKRLEAVVAVQNTASQRVLEKVGFEREGVLRKYYLLKGNPVDAVIFSLFSST